MQKYVNHISLVILSYVSVEYLSSRKVPLSFKGHLTGVKKSSELFSSLHSSSGKGICGGFSDIHEKLTCKLACIQ